MLELDSPLHQLEKRNTKRSSHRSSWFSFPLPTVDLSQMSQSYRPRIFTNFPLSTSAQPTPKKQISSFSPTSRVPTFASCGELLYLPPVTKAGTFDLLWDVGNSAEVSTLHIKEKEKEKEQKNEKSKRDISYIFDSPLFYLYILCIGKS